MSAHGKVSRACLVNHARTISSLVIPRAAKDPIEPGRSFVATLLRMTVWCTTLLSLCWPCSNAQARNTVHPTRLVFDRVHFRFGSDRLTALEQFKVEQNARALQVYDDVVIWLEGHTDAIGAARANLELGDRRVRRVAATLIAAGVDPERIAGLVSLGEQRTKVPYNPRRVEMQER